MAMNERCAFGAPLVGSASLADLRGLVMAGNRVRRPATAFLYALAGRRSAAPLPAPHVLR